jgi:hypothetical protein
MYLLYIDHSGEVANANERYFVMGGAAVFERQIYFVTQELERLKQDYLPNVTGPVEFHASAMRNHNKPPWDQMPKEKREELIAAIYDVIAKAHRPGFTLFGQAIEKSCVIPDFSSQISVALRDRREAEKNAKLARGKDKAKAKAVLQKAEEQCWTLTSRIVARGFEGICTQFEYFLRRFYDQAQPEREQRGLMIVDHASYEKELELLMEQFQTYGTRVTGIYNIVEAPLCMDSNSTRMLQVADFVSYAIFRRYESADTGYFDLVADRFDELEGVMHGLAHITSNHRCRCPSCLSRRVTRRRL